MNKTGIAVFGGSFNPPTVAHINLAKQVLEEMNEIDKVIFVPVSTKYNKKGLAPDEVRLNMLKSICNSQENLEVSDLELKSERQLYTIETLRIIEEQKPEKEIYFLIGTDNLKELETWYKPDELLKNFKIIVLDRGEDNTEDIIEKSEFLKKYKSSFIKLKNMKKMNISSTYIREQLKLGNNVQDLVPEEIRAEVERIYK